MLDYKNMYIQVKIDPTRKLKEKANIIIEQLVEQKSSIKHKVIDFPNTI